MEKKHDFEHVYSLRRIEFQKHEFLLVNEMNVYLRKYEKQLLSSNKLFCVERSGKSGLQAIFPYKLLEKNICVIAYLWICL